MQCEDAPCEVVCPVGATVHDSEGINVQVYNRCVGTRFCSNNCPYKVRRFNFLHFSAGTAEPPLEARNPEVTLRMRGVMEKCNYCLQRITRARLETEREGRRIADGEVVTACQAACPTRAITFGDLARSEERGERRRSARRSTTRCWRSSTRARAGSSRGIGIWGVNIPVAWGFAIVNFVWWIGIGHAGTFISAFLLLLPQKWRNSINRFAEAMTLFAGIAGSGRSCTWAARGSSTGSCRIPT